MEATGTAPINSPLTKRSYRRPIAFISFAEAHRALELLEDYHSRLSTPQDRALRSAIERVIRIFKSRLFQALLDIQEFYELTLLDESKTVQQKTAETLLIASKWEQDNAIKANEVSTTGKADACTYGFLRRK
uniref:L27 domain-containing protein n=1 Tax=Anopheles dirus TaxID=7168 RepID=A0A182N0Q1_9DIPT